MAKHILSVSYDESLLLTRQMLLRQPGYEVRSALSLTEALESCKKSKFDLILMCHSILRKDKQAFMKEVRKASTARILSILHAAFAPLAEADYSVRSADGPAALVAAVGIALGQDSA